ncbi:MAG: transcription antitermination factor NusB, partial [Thermodesulfobacteriota bacterium]
MNFNNNPRYLSIRILSQNQQRIEPVDIIMDRMLSRIDLIDPRDSHLIMALVYGVLRHQRYLDAVLSYYSRHPLSKMKEFTLQALRVGAFQLLFMDRIPISAAVNETVKAVRNAYQPKWLVSYVNGVLRALSKDGYRPDLWGEDNWSLPVKLSHPDWFYERCLKHYGSKKTREICEYNNRQPCLTLCLNLSAVSRERFIDILASRDIRAIPGRYVQEAVIIPGYSGRISGLPGYNLGWFMVQDEGAQMITRMLAPFQPGSYLDACAGVGGKTVQLNFLVPRASRLSASEPNQKRFNLLKENLQRMGLASVINLYNISLQDLRRQTEARYNSILIDAPCSGLGVIRRHPDIRWNFI